MLLLMSSLPIDFSFNCVSESDAVEWIGMHESIIFNAFKWISCVLIVIDSKADEIFLKQTPYKLNEINFLSVHISIRSQIFSLFIITIRLKDFCVYAHSIEQFNSLI